MVFSPNSHLKLAAFKWLVAYDAKSNFGPILFSNDVVGF